MISRFEKEILIAHALGLSRAQLLARGSDKLDAALYQPLLDRRAKHEPTAYITGYQPFMGLNFIVNRSVLIPRPETEFLVETAIGLLSNQPIFDSRFSILDLGTGSGCIAVSLAKHLPNAEITGLDSSPAALAIAKQNAETHQVSNRCKFVLGDLFEKLTGQAQRTLRTQSFDLIISNPPYIPTQIIETLQPEVRDWEPRQALEGGEAGLDYLRTIITESPKKLKETGYLMLEFGDGQAEKLFRLSKKNFNETKILNDYSGKERILIAAARSFESAGFF